MNWSRSRPDGGGEASSSQDQNHENERRWQQERLHREEAYYQFINDLNDEDYRLMRDHNLLGTPGEITSEELQQRLDGVKEQLASQPDLRNGTNTRDSGVPRESSNEESLLEWLNTFRRTGNATRSGQNGNQTWRAVSRTNPHSGEFQFCLEIHINHENRGFEMDGEDYVGVPLSDVSQDHTTDGPQRSSSPVARRTRSQAAGALSGSSASVPRTRLGLRGRSSVEGSLSALGRLRNGIGGAVGTPRTGAARANPSGGSELRQREGQRFGAAHVWENGARTNVTVRNTNQRLEPIRLRSTFNSRSRSPIQRQSGTVYHSSQRESRPFQQTSRRSVRRRGITRVFLEQGREGRGTAYTPFSNSRLVSRITVEEEESSRSSTAARRHPTITLDLQVRRVRPGESRDWDSIANRTRSRVGLAANTVTIESSSGGFRRTISRLERSGMRTYVSTITVPLRRISENELAEPSSVALRSVLRQIMTGFGELGSLMEAESESEAQRSGQRRPETHSEVSLLGEAVSQHRGGSPQGRWTREDSPDTPPRAPHRGGRRSQNSSNLVETGTLPILRLAHFLLNEGEDDDRMRGLTKEQIDNLSTRSYEHSSIDSERGKICSVCISDYVTGNKLRQLPCMHEFHIHCIDRWLSENCTCPICRQPVLGSSTANNG
ncbi:E3 ubiquitin-protein ligase RNF6 isoform X1 [Sagmatias obliquidens]|uniref:E3 ubiquitin-protein ligase RNF6 isoform X1 n=1 Tax=Sagmatias obliquidens TaxID=3371155 RepID=UPI000F4461ED|nr:E3 ubiquitin-protein ligase RNF6 isoform X1 [Lagenorhynchus obliquidens]XP_026972449.1 E3 ubiquitin-protein ligase RNF6 isoform X1 [Lagenorhynchus obliquidens]XP_026972450.1 E3 ubiquitin-protein ligase RNF6 isoform X1 [Lagenorhynchus obliquidens]XP_026972451.1 E3 ubiquitin-protein ligase RNF6 isoform X1 [Lagenorhynchus obliquidens]XP_026972452.1 E3 ubiquitin-protein ligase RNF6 isoform X1 [Lagenorhynchus obliquidens]XP_026972453.1 E3 ubiquitin-protein ligase RNF6 isoform X1 [Lagenorhynchus 